MGEKGGGSYFGYTVAKLPLTVRLDTECRVRQVLISLPGKFTFDETYSSLLSKRKVW